MNQPPLELLTDEYQLAMAQSYIAQGIADEPVVFELSIRKLPSQRGYLVVAGLSRVVEYLTNLSFSEPALAYLERTGTCSAETCRRLAEVRFDGDLDAIPEGTVAFAGEPLLRVSGPRMVCQIAESFLLNQVCFQTMVASKAARIVQAAAGRPVVDFGFRRAHGSEAGLWAARSAWIGGCAGTATVAAGYEWGIPTSGTMAHSYVLSFPSEVAAFRAFLRDHPNRSTLLIDTYDSLAGARAAADAARAEGVVPQAVRLDSGDLDELSRDVRSILDDAGLPQTQIICSGDLDEYRIDALVRAEAPIDAFGVGTRLVTSSDAPAPGGIYKLSQSAGRPVMKTSHQKLTLPGSHQVYRDGGADTVALDDERLPGRPLLEPVLRGGRLVQDGLLALDQARERAATEVAGLPPEVRMIDRPGTLPPQLSPRLAELREALVG
ncbi:MAG: nicotinate phosphoribosyltransferase [Gaiellales bacterium]